ncbi:serine hydrolase domain-containing protein [Actinoallomurus rhizosphaericola]|uniref:serine hydrolase domain-containing protein n=1 Tax=Actinoallomurus rhizosphaericola TaxID=2952536 RepID=UPI002093D157|nr:serine hydrolase domain-containing protein [Actinoallomurus rhizosphaericola]MCO5999700.1 beta-lactamase family protein [Actinoallomurus rhizosphaericola]
MNSGDARPVRRAGRWSPRRRPASAAVLAGVLAVGACGTSAPPHEAVPQSYGQGRLQHDADAIVATGVTGVQARVTGDGGDLVATSGVGDVHSRRPVKPDDHFRIGSSTKTFTATVILQLAGEKSLSLDDTVEHWLPGVVRGNGNDGSKITIRELLQHTSGLNDGPSGHETPADYYRHRFDVVPPDEVVKEAMKHRPSFAPGTSWKYSNAGYILLAMIIKRVTGHPWSEEVDRRIVRPLGLRNTTVPGLSPDLPAPHPASYDRFPDGALIDVTLTREAYTADAAGAMISTTADLDRFYRALLTGRLLRPAELAEMKRTVPVNAKMRKAFPGARYGFALFSIPLSCGGRYWGHGGDILGFMTRNGFTEDGRRGAVVSMSTEFEGSDAAAERQGKAALALIDHALCRTG